MKNAGQLEGQFCTCLCKDTDRTGQAKSKHWRGFAAGQPEGQTQDCPVFCPISLLGIGQKDKRDTEQDAEVTEEADSDLFAELLALIARCCDARGDEPANRVALIDECSRLQKHEQEELLEHFSAEAKRFEAANRGVAL